VLSANCISFSAKRESFIYDHWCPVKFRRFLPTVEMTRTLEYLVEVGVGGGEAATNPHSITLTICHSDPPRRRGISCSFYNISNFSRTLLIYDLCETINQSFSKLIYLLRSFSKVISEIRFRPSILTITGFLKRTCLKNPAFLTKVCLSSTSQRTKFLSLM